jgi:hypothetical protein
LSDLVILYGVKWLLDNNTFPFESYTVEYGNENKNGFDICATGNGKTLIGEAFNVAQSFFQTKKSTMLKKLAKSTADYKRSTRRWALPSRDDVRGCESD